MAKKLPVEEYMEDALRSFEDGMHELRAAKSEIEELVDELVTARSTIEDLEDRIATMEFEDEKE